jgi:hypothetical protein
VLAALPNADPGAAVRGLVVALSALLDPTDAERAEARAGVLAALPDADPRELEGLVVALRTVMPVPPWLAWVANSE